MTLIDNWKRTLTRAYSMWFGAYLPILWLGGVEVMWALFNLQISPVLVWAVAIVLPALVPFLRIIKQRE